MSPWMRWDALWYQRIAIQGYSATDGTAPFHPLFAWLATPLIRIGICPSLSLLMISSLAGIALFYCFFKLAQLDLLPNDASFALILLAFAPPAFILFAPYPEGLFLLTSVLCLFFARQKLWWLSGLMGGLATLTRQQGLFLFFPMIVELWENSQRELKVLIKKWRDWITLGLIPVGMLVWLLYRAFFINDVQISTSNFQEFIYSALISPSATQVVPTQKFIWPWQAFYYSFLKLVTQPDLDVWVDLITGIFFLIILAITWKKMRLSYRVYSLVIALVSFSFYTGSAHPYMGLSRHLFLAFPIFIGLATSINKMWARFLVVGFSAISMFFLLLLYGLNTWVP
ncbi:MAG: hypothetical protein WAV05_16035 [Anaerolineales bacterium]